MVAPRDLPGAATHLEWNPLLGVEGLVAHLLGGDLKVLGAADLVVAAAVVGALGALEHKGQAKLGGGLLERGLAGVVGAGLDGHLLGDGDALLDKVLLLLVLVLDEADGLPGGVDGDLFPVGLAVGAADLDALGGDLLEDVGLDVLDLDGEHVAARGQLPDLVRVLEGARDVQVVVVGLLGGASLGVEHGDLDAQRPGLLAEHLAQLASAEKTNDGLGHDG